MNGQVMVIGVRGMLNLQGGVETHAEQLYERLARLGWDVVVLVRSPYVSRRRRAHGLIRLHRLWSPRASGLEALVHSLIGVLYAAAKRPDLLHIHAIGPAIVTPLARLLGLTVVVTHHGPDYERDKWGVVARLTLKAGEQLGMRSANARIAISNTISDQVRSRCGRACEVILNGVPPADLQAETDEIERCGLAPRRYFLQVSRIVPEKRQLDLIEAFAAARLPDWKLAFVGAGSNAEYARRVQDAARSTPGVVLVGFRKGSALKQLYSHAGAFVLPSSHEGLPIAILEALSYGLPVIASDIAANREIGLGADCYYPVGDTAELAVRLAAAAAAHDDEIVREARRRWVAQNYDWDGVARRTSDLYHRVLGDPAPLSTPPVAPGRQLT